jgi:hypothetical protein
MAKPLAVEAITTSPSPARGFNAVLPYRAAVVAPDPHLRGRDHPAAPRLDRVTVAQAQPGQQALLVLAYLRKDETFASLAAGFDVSAATARRYVSETAGCSPPGRRSRAMPCATRRGPGTAFVIMDGTLIPIDRIAKDRPFYSGKHKRHGMKPAGHRQS